ncbi:hypothetical protein C8R44DRAFT_886762 [Mycena epipterygia]|nr:hypothetical protein C8R44DRAFT_886762 [Mycena epipterygia]
MQRWSAFHIPVLIALTALAFHTACSSSRPRPVTSVTCAPARSSQRRVASASDRAKRRGKSSPARVLGSGRRAPCLSAHLRIRVQSRCIEVELWTQLALSLRPPSSSGTHAKRASLPGRRATEAQDPPARDLRTPRPRIAAGAHSSRRPKTARRNPSPPQAYSASIRPWSNRSALVDGHLAQCRGAVRRAPPTFSRIVVARGACSSARVGRRFGPSRSSVQHIACPSRATRFAALLLLLRPPHEIGTSSVCIAANAKHLYFSTSRACELATMHGIFNSKSTHLRGFNQGTPAHDARTHALLPLTLHSRHVYLSHVVNLVSSVYDRADTNFSVGDTLSRVPSKRHSSQSPFARVTWPSAPIRRLIFAHAGFLQLTSYPSDISQGGANDLSAPYPEHPSSVGRIGAALR